MQSGLCDGRGRGDGDRPRSRYRVRAWTMVVPAAAGVAVFSAVVLGLDAASVPLAIPAVAQIGAGRTASPRPPTIATAVRPERTKIVARDNPILVIDDSGTDPTEATLPQDSGTTPYGTSGSGVPAVTTTSLPGSPNGSAGESGDGSPGGSGESDDGSHGTVPPTTTIPSTTTTTTTTTTVPSTTTTTTTTTTTVPDDDGGGGGDS